MKKAGAAGGAIVAGVGNSAGPRFAVSRQIGQFAGESGAESLRPLSFAMLRSDCEVPSPTDRC